MDAKGGWRSSYVSRSLIEAEPSAQAPLEHSGWHKRFESAQSDRFAAGQMSKLGRLARHNPTHACRHLGSVESLLDVVDETLSESTPHFLVDGQRRAHCVCFRRKVGSYEPGLDERDADAEGSDLHS